MSEQRTLHRRRPIWLPWLLVLTIVAQMAIPLQAHTVLSKGHDGQVMVLCTWHGTREVALGGPGETPTNPAERISPACLFSQLLGAAGLTDCLATPQPIFLSATPVEDWQDREPLPQAWRTYVIRGPPDGRDVT